MTIVQLITRRQFRGAEIFNALVSEALAARGHRVTLIGLGTALEQQFRPAGVEVVDLDATLSRLPSPRVIARLRKELNRISPDIVQANASHTLKYASFAKRLSSDRWKFVYWNGNMMSWFIHSPAQRTWIRWLLSPASHVVSVSEECNADHQRTFGRSAEEITTIPMGTHIPPVIERAAARRKLQEYAASPSGAPLLVHAAGYVPEKNHIGLIDAFQQIHRSHPGVQLFLFGDGPLRVTVEAEIDNRSLRQSVHVMGSRADVRELMSGADLLLLPSHIEGMPGVILEAAARSVPSVCTRVGGVHEAVEHRETGLLVPPGDTAAFAAAVSELLSDAVRRLRMGVAARALVCRRYDVQRLAERFEALYYGLTAPT